MTATRPCPFEEDVLVLEDCDLSFERHLQVEAHLGVCDACATLEDALHRATDALRALEDPPLGAVEAALARLPARRRPVRWIAVGAAAAAALFVALVPSFEDASPGAPPDAPSVPVAEVPSPPPAGPRWNAGTPLNEMLDAVGAEDAVLLDRIAGIVQRGGAARGAELARAIAWGEPARVLRALDVAERAPSLQLAAPLVALLNDADSDPALAGRAAALLGRTRARAVVPALTAALDGPAGAAALDSLARIETDDAYEALSRHTRTVPADACGSVLSTAVSAAPTTGARLLLEVAATEETRATAWSVLDRDRVRLLPPLREIAGGGDAIAAAAAAEALGEARDDESVPLLVELAGRRVTDRAAARALLRIGTEDSIRAAAVAAASRASLADAFDDVRAAEPVLVVIVEHGTGGNRRSAIALLGRCGGDGSVPVLERHRLPRTLHPDAVVSLGGIGGAAAAAALGEYGRDATLLGAVIDALGANGSPAAVTELRRLAHKGEARHVARSLGRIHHAESARELVEMVRSGPASSDASEALAALPLRVVVPVLIEALDDPLRQRRLRRILSRITGADHGASADAWRTWWETHS